MNKETIKEIVRWILIVVNAILAGIGTDAAARTLELI